ncbi:hypothetical protein QA995_02195 [Streptomyces scabiei]|uniref:hypothetical protein n=1 Tax=Streptomyces scabiei TaxID=1930 RepID=UPI001B307BAF|nr:MULTISPECIES: hypothetical protein [Streptomyces]MBP5869284.1 hypothetical protein [Streptomyces sp. LBUM 1485]MBP5914782.1 hypothetical protein [Streptomyces sp. LBUM 1486]MDX3029288.1 hypothetical protein [Streptomyces scabiei]MDX3208407.1 hypothetical protein [Streptomyces scabiei]QTU55800.1 hypothetical protein F3K21_25800 [Streptomyces sp. LBUM 1480]
MSLPVSRLIGVVLVLAGISGALWAALGVPQDWTGAMRWMRTVLALTSLGAIGLGARFVYPDRAATDTPDGAPTSADADAPCPADTAAPEGPDPSRV